MFLDLGPNIELVTLTLLITSAYFTQKISFVTTLLILFISDLIIGNTNIFIFTWSGFLIPTLILPKIFKTKKQKGIKQIFKGATLGAGANFFFFLWTNLGVWLLDSWNMYPNTFQGLAYSYTNAIPFWRYQLTSTLAFSFVGFSIFEYSPHLSKLLSLKKSKHYLYLSSTPNKLKNHQS